LDEDTKLNKTFARVLEAECTVKGKDPFGTVSDGYLKIAAPLLEMSCVRCFRDVIRACDLKPLSCQSGASSAQITVWYDTGCIVDHDDSFFCLFIGELSCGADGLPCRGLVLRKRRDIPGITYERIGSFCLAKEGERDFIQGIEDSVVVII
jgi:hypothetical protein